MAIVLVDARNVQRSRWPNLPDEEVVARARDWAERHGHRVILVFDGRAPGGQDDDRITVVGSGRESADEWLIREAPSYPGAWLVTSDRALRDQAGTEAARVIGGGTFLGELEK